MLDSYGDLPLAPLPLRPGSVAYLHQFVHEILADARAFHVDAAKGGRILAVKAQCHGAVVRHRKTRATEEREIVKHGEGAAALGQFSRKVVVDSVR